jgi:hypothetical protein
MDGVTDGLVDHWMVRWLNVRATGGIVCGSVDCWTDSV